MPISGKGWELHVTRSAEQSRSDRRRTIGAYAIYHDGVATALTGTSVEAKGPGNNEIKGCGRCIEPGIYPLATHDGEHYKTIGYITSDDCDQTPKPGLELRKTDYRDAILIHPGHGFLASIGCINLTASLADGSVDIAFINSRERVVAAIKDLRAYLGDGFPHYNGQPITKARVVID